MRRVLRAALIASAMCAAHAGTVHAATPGPQVPVMTSALTRIGTISIPRLGVSQPIYRGVSNNIFDVGVGYWPGTALPGQPGNMVIGGHRTVGARPFYDIQLLRSGDTISVTRRGTTHTYKVTGHRIVKATAMWITDQTPTPTLTLFSCHPRGSTRLRYVVQATLAQ